MNTREQADPIPLQKIMLTNMACLSRGLLIFPQCHTPSPAAHVCQIWWQGELTILHPGPSQQPGPVGIGRSWALGSLPAQTLVALWFGDSSAPNACSVSLFYQRHLLGLLFLPQTSGGTSDWQLTMTTGQSSPPQLTSPFAVLQEVQLGRFFPVDLSILLWRTEPTWWLSPEQSTTEILLALCSTLLLRSWYWLQHFLLFSSTAHHQLHGCFIYTGLCEDSMGRSLLGSHSFKIVSMRKIASWEKNKNHWW